MRSRAATLAVSCLATAAAAAGACPQIAAAWGPPRTNGLGTQTLRGGSGPDYLRGAEGPDTIRGNGGGDLLTGDTGPDRVNGGSGSDTLTGGAGGDALVGGPGNDIAFGGFGADRIDGGPGDDALDGNNDNDKLFGGDGNDVLHGGSGIDKIDGGPGNDRIFSDSGADIIAAGDGDDTVVVDGANKAVVSCGPGNDTLYIAVDADATEDYVGRGPQTRYSQCETVWITDALRDPNKGITYLAPDRGGKRDGTARDDTLLGGPGPDSLRGGAGNDVLWGLRQPNVASGSTDILDAEAGDDTVYGGPGPQQILGGAGDDFLEGGLGNGTIAGGSGDDTIRLRGGGVTKVSAGAGNDAIYARGTARAQIRCGGGRDVAHADSGDSVARDCERVVGRAARRRTPAKPRGVYSDTIATTPGLAYWWRLGEQSSPSFFNVNLVDSKAGAPATYFGRLGIPGVTDDGSTAFEAVTTYSNGAYTTSGEPYVSPGISNAILHGQFTYEAWYRFDDSGTPRALLSDVNGGSAQGVVLVREASGALRAAITSGADDTQPIAVATPPLNLERFSWHHVALTRADDRIAIYVDGTMKAEAAATPKPSLVDTYGIGVGSRFSTYKGWAGGIDEIAFYDRPLDAATVLAHATIGDDGSAPVARADPPAGTLQSRSGLIHLTTGKAGASFRCSLDGAAYSACRPDVPLDQLSDGGHDLRVLATSRTGVPQTAPTTVHFAIDAGLPGTVVAVRLAPLNDSRAIVTFGSDDSAATFECRRGRSFSSQNAGYVPCSAPLDVTPGARFEVRAVDAAGNRDPGPASIEIPPAGSSFGYLSLLPTFAGSRAEARIAGELSVGYGYNFQCRLDGRDWTACSNEFLLPILDPGVHRMEVRQPFPGSATATTAPMTWTVAARPGDVAIAGLQMQLVIERSARLVRRAPRVRFALSHPAAVSVDVLRRGRTPAIHVAVRGLAGANLVKIAARKLNALGEGRYTVRVTARGATGRTAVQLLPLAIVPPLR